MLPWSIEKPEDCDKDDEGTGGRQAAGGLRIPSVRWRACVLWWREPGDRVGAKRSHGQA
jgi:hypothetical protein